MNKIKNIFELLCRTMIVVGMAGLLLYGYERVMRTGISTAIIVFILTFVFLVYEGKEKDKKDTKE